MMQIQKIILKILAIINKELSIMADEVIEIVYGIEVRIK